MLRYKTKTRPGLVALYDIRPGNGAGQFLQPRSPHEASITIRQTTVLFYILIYTCIYSRSSCCLILCRNHFLVGDCGHPVRVRRQFQHTDASVVYARRSALLDLPDLMHGWRSSSPSNLLTYNIMNVRISTVSNISTGTSLNFYIK